MANESDRAVYPPSPLLRDESARFVNFPLLKPIFSSNIQTNIRERIFTFVTSKQINNLILIFSLRNKITLSPKSIGIKSTIKKFQVHSVADFTFRLK